MLSTDSIYEGRARLLESLLFILKNSTQDAINLFLLQIRNPRLQASDLLEAFNQLFEHCQREDTAQTISTCLYDISSLTYNDMLSLLDCLSTTFVKSSPGKAVSLVNLPSGQPASSSVDCTRDEKAIELPQPSTVAIKSGSLPPPAVCDRAVVQQTVMVHPMMEHIQPAYPILSSQKDHGVKERQDELLPRPFQTTTTTSTHPLNGPDTRVYDVPLLDPRGDFSNYCLDVRNSGRRALARGISMNRLSCWGRMDCELLFRDRVAEDDWNVPGWACEVSPCKILKC